MRWLIFGACGFVGQRLLARLRKQGVVCFGADVRPMSGEDLLVGDIRDTSYVGRCFASVEPDVCVHLASFGMSGSEMANKAMTWDVNENGTRNVADCCKLRGCLLIYISTVNVCFNGTEIRNGAEDCPYVDASSHTDAYRLASFILVNMCCNSLSLLKCEQDCC
jgi:dTDP-4-dehydrorhamnose reductase